MKNLSVINRSNLSYSFFFTGTLRSMQLSKKNTSSLSACCLIFLCSFFGLCKKYHVRNFSTTTQKYEIVQILQEAHRIKAIISIKLNAINTKALRSQPDLYLLNQIHGQRIKKIRLIQIVKCSRLFIALKQDGANINKKNTKKRHLFRSFQFVICFCYNLSFSLFHFIYFVADTAQVSECPLCCTYKYRMIGDRKKEAS